VHDGFEDLLDAAAVLAAGEDRSVAVETDDVFELALRLVGCADGRSILLMTGMISRLFSTAR
jgi:hypothetical protein